MSGPGHSPLRTVILPHAYCNSMICYVHMHMHTVLSVHTQCSNMQVHDCAMLWLQNHIIHTSQILTLFVFVEPSKYVLYAKLISDSLRPIRRSHSFLRFLLPTPTGRRKNFPFVVLQARAKHGDGAIVITWWTMSSIINIILHHEPQWSNY